MIGISKEDLEALIYTDDYGNYFIDPDQAIAACKELNPRRIVLEEISKEEYRRLHHDELSSDIYNIRSSYWREAKENS